MEKNKFLETLKGKDVKITQKDNFIKSGIFEGYDANFVFIKYNDGSKVAISRDAIISIKVSENKVID